MTGISQSGPTFIRRSYSKEKRSKNDKKWKTWVLSVLIVIWLVILLGAVTLKKKKEKMIKNENFEIYRYWLWFDWQN